MSIMIMTSNEIISFLKQNSEFLRNSFGVTRIGLFGSYAKGRQTASSDIDIIVELEQSKKDIHTFLKLKRFLEKEMGRKIDLGFEHSLKPEIKDKVIKQIIYV